ncbi:MAG: hypothetical protein ACTHLN_14210 [Tepidisphaeraceae bacterium]
MLQAKSPPLPELRLHMDEIKDCIEKLVESLKPLTRVAGNGDVRPACGKASDGILGLAAESLIPIPAEYTKIAHCSKKFGRAGFNPAAGANGLASRRVRVALASLSGLVAMR